MAFLAPQNLHQNRRHNGMHGLNGLHGLGGLNPFGNAALARSPLVNNPYRRQNNWPFNGVGIPGLASGLNPFKRFGSPRIPLGLSPLSPLNALTPGIGIGGLTPFGGSFNPFAGGLHTGMMTGGGGCCNSCSMHPDLNIQMCQHCITKTNNVNYNVVNNNFNVVGLVEDPTPCCCQHCQFGVFAAACGGESYGAYMSGALGGAAYMGAGFPSGWVFP